jgi:hypothetical protein
MDSIKDKIDSLMIELSQCEKRTISIIHEIEEIRRECTHMEDANNTAFKKAGYNGLKDIFECSICGKRTNKI